MRHRDTEDTQGGRMFSLCLCGEGFCVGIKNMASVLRLGVWLISFIVAAGSVAAKPFIPADDAQVLERLPEKTNPSLAELKRLRSTLAQNPHDLALPAQLPRP